MERVHRLFRLHSKLRVLSHQRRSHCVWHRRVWEHQCHLKDAQTIHFALKQEVFASSSRSQRFPPVRYFAAQGKQNDDKKNSSSPLLNEEIKAPYVRLVMDEGHQVVRRNEALEQAKRLGLDLVEVQKDADPPVCKIMDYHKEKYKRQTKEKEKTKNKSEPVLKNETKEIRFTAKTEHKDLQMKANMIMNMMERGYRVKCVVRGKQDQDLQELLSRLTNLIADSCYVENGPNVEAHQAWVLVRHARFTKKGGTPGKSAAKDAKSPNNQGLASASPSGVGNVIPDPPIHGEEVEAAEADTEQLNLSVKRGTAETSSGSKQLNQSTDHTFDSVFPSVIDRKPTRPPSSIEGRPSNRFTENPMSVDAMRPGRFGHPDAVRLKPSASLDSKQSNTSLEDTFDALFSSKDSSVVNGKQTRLAEGSALSGFRDIPKYGKSAPPLQRPPPPNPGYHKPLVPPPRSQHFSKENVRSAFDIPKPSTAPNSSSHVKHAYPVVNAKPPEGHRDSSYNKAGGSRAGSNVLESPKMTTTSKSFGIFSTPLSPPQKVGNNQQQPTRKIDLRNPESSKVPAASSYGIFSSSKSSEVKNK